MLRYTYTRWKRYAEVVKSDSVWSLQLSMVTTITICLEDLRLDPYDVNCELVLPL